MEYNINFEEIRDKVFINMPIDKIGRYIGLVEKHRFNLEISIDYSMDNFSLSEIRDYAARLNELGIRMTVHAPYNEIFLGAPDKLIREASLKRMDLAFEVIGFFNPLSVVVHLNFENRRFGFFYDEWLSLTLDNIKKYINKCIEMGSILVIENVYEETPDVILEIISAMNGYPVYHCVDVGHVNAFSDSDLQMWIDKTSGFIRQFHLHDNDGTDDAHDAIGNGNINFNLIVDFISNMEKVPIITLEPHTEENLWRSLHEIKRIGLVDVIKR